MSAVVQQPITAAPEPIDVDLRKSYVTGGSNLWLGGPGTLGGSDELTFRYGVDVYERMMRDPDVWAAVALLKILVLADDLQIEPCVNKKELPGYEIAVRNSDFLRRSVKGMRTAYREVFEQMLDALVYGNKVAEITFKDGAGEDAGRLVLDSIKVKPQSAIQFVVDFFWNLIGFLPAWRLQGDRREVLPREKFFVLSLHTKDSDPRGRSSLASAHDAWSFKQKIYPIWLRWYKQCAIPSLKGKTAPNQKAETQIGSDGKPLLKNGKPVTLTPEQAMAEALAAFENGTFIVLKNGAEVDPIEVHGTGEQFDPGLTFATKQITRAILLQELATLDATHQTKGSTGEMMNLVEGSVATLKGKLVDAFRRDVVETSLIVNFGEAALEYMPHISLGDSARKDWAEDGKVVVALVSATIVDEDGNRVPALTPSQIQALLSQIGIPPPTDDEIAAMRTAREQRRQQAQQPNQGQPGNQPPAQPQQDKKAA